jgi:hypothetical protein
MLLWLSFTDFAQAGGEKFYGSIVVLQERQQPPTENGIGTTLAIGLHPTSAAVAKANACAKLAGGMTIFDGTSCLNSVKSSLTCSSGGYYAAASGRPLDLVRQENWTWGLTCGKKTIELARTAAIQACEKSRETRSLMQQTEPCKLDVAAKNDGKFRGQVLDVIAQQNQSKEPIWWDVEPKCWGTERVADGFAPEEIVKICGSK